MNRLSKFIAVLVAAGAGTGPALAHAGSAAHDLADGFAHPMTGVDHLLAMVAVGLWAATRPRRQAWQAPAAFLAALTIGAFAGLTFGASAMVEPVVATSLIALSALLLLSPRIGDRAGLAVIAGFALFHGYAHGGEATGGIGGFFAGFLIASAALHMGGYAIGTRVLASRVGRVAAGAGIGIAGLALTFA